MPSRRVSCSAMRPRNSAVIRSTEPLLSPWASRPSRSQSGTKGASASIVSGRTAAMLTALVTTPPDRARLTWSAVIVPGAVLRLRGRRAKVRSDDDVVAAEERVLGERLRGEDVEGRAADLARLECRLQRVEVDELAASAVDDPDAVLHLRDGLGVDPVDGVRRLGEVDRDDVRLGVELVRRLRVLHPQLPEALGGDELVERDHVHLERLRALRDQLADAAEADHAEGLAVELVAGELGARPLAGRKGGVGPRNVPGQRQREGQRVLGGGDRVRLGGVDHHDAALGRCIDVDVVDAGPGTAHNLEARGPLDQVGGDLRRRADDDRVEVADAVRELVVRHVEPELDVEVLTQERDAGVGDLLLDQDPRLAVGARH